MSRLNRIVLLTLILASWTLPSGADAASAPVSAVTVTQVQNVNEPGLNPYQHFVTFNQGTTYCYNFACTIAFPAVPEGKRLVITYASALGGQYMLTNGEYTAQVSVAGYLVNL
jgi:hypothetical protein